MEFQRTVDCTKDYDLVIGTNIDYCCDEQYAVVYTSEARMKRQIKNIPETVYLEERIFPNRQSEWKVKVPWKNITIST